MLVKCPCSNCGGFVEFDASDFVEGTDIDCPHCEKNTLLYLPKKASQPRTMAASVTVSQPSSGRDSSKTQTLLIIGGIAFFVVGVGMVLDGCAAAFQEQQLAATAEGGSAIRGIENVAEYGIGFVLVALSLIMGGISKLIRLQCQPVAQWEK